MATFKNRICDGDVDQNIEARAGCLLYATLLWLRSIDGDIGYANYIRLCVPFSNDLYFGTHCPDPEPSCLPVSNGQVLPVMNSGMHIVWSRSWRTELNLGYMQIISDQTKVHMNWVEWALGTAIRKLWEANIDWIPKPKPQTIGGFEVADLDL